MNESNKISRRELFKMATLKSEKTAIRPPRHGGLTLDKSRCTGCGLCASDCSSGALMLAKKEENLILRFEAGECAACGKCAAICPEKCLILREAATPSAGSAVLYEDKIVRCRECGAPIGTGTMLNILKKRIGDKALFAQLELCVECKMKPASLR